MTLAEMLEHAGRRLQEAGIDQPMREARLLLGAALGVDGAALMAKGGRTLSASEEEKTGAWLARRAAREPLARLRGRREFWNAAFRLNEAVLEPRPDSETLIEAALEECADRSACLRILDAGTGSGCLLLSLLQEYPEARGVGTDKSPRALEAARENARELFLDSRAEFVCANWTGQVAGPFNLIVGNPPYVASGDLERLQPEVRLYDPILALDGGRDGLAAYRALAPVLPGLLAEGGRVILESGAGQARAVAEILAGAGFGRIKTRLDLGGVERAVIAAKHGQ